MNWEAISAVGEILGVLVVVITLLYVAREVRQNSHALGVSALSHTTTQWNTWSNMVATSPELAGIVAKGNENFTSLTPAERLQFGAWVQSFFDNVEAYRNLVVEHRIEKDLDVLIKLTQRRLQIPGFRAGWQENTSDYADDFVTWINKLGNSGSQ